MESDMESLPISVPSKKSVKKAGDILKSANSDSDMRIGAVDILSRWRSLHAYPINTFQAYLRSKIKRDGYRNAIVAQRLKRMPSIISKLQRFPDMQLDRMQDLGGLRVVLEKIDDVYTLHKSILHSKRLGHQPELPPKDYIKSPKKDGYRSLHQVFKYTNKIHPELNGLRVELQIRSKLQHSWATAVETLGIIEKSSFKTGEGNEKIKDFFKLSSALFSLEENSPIREEYSTTSRSVLIDMLDDLENDIQVCSKLQGITISAKHIETTSKKSDKYHVMELDIDKNRISLIPFLEGQLEHAEALYRQRENETKDKPHISVVLISAGNIANIKKAYPNYFLDTAGFIKSLKKVREKC